MDQPNYNFAYHNGGIMKFVWKNSVGQYFSSSSSNDSTDNGSSYGQNNSWGKQQTKADSGSSQQPNKNGDQSQK